MKVSDIKEYICVQGTMILLFPFVNERASRIELIRH